MHCDLDLGDMTLGQGHDTLLCHGQQLREILSRSNMAERSMARTRIWVCVHCDLDITNTALSQGHDTPLGYGQ